MFFAHAARMVLSEFNERVNKSKLEQHWYLNFIAIITNCAIGNATRIWLSNLDALRIMGQVGPANDLRDIFICPIHL